jgi:hypothetical protein
MMSTPDDLLDTGSNGAGVSAFLKFSASLDSLSSELRESNRARARQQGAIHPNDLPAIVGTPTPGGGANAPVSFAPAYWRPPDGWAWAITRISAGGLSGGVGASTSLEGSVTSPSANTAIVTLTGALPTGLVTVQWSVELDGTVGAVDGDNFQLRYNANTIAQSDNDPAVGRYQQNTVQMFISNPPATALVIRNSAAGTLGSIYSAQYTITSVGTGDSVSFFKNATGGNQNAVTFVNASNPVALMGKGLILRQGQTLYPAATGLVSAGFALGGEIHEVRDDLLWRYLL